MEWEKHRALRPVTCPKYESGRVVCVCGSTDDHNVYAALEDLKYTCERYFKECSTALARMNDNRHELGIYYLDWRVEARGFKPISVQFEVERNRTLDVLVGEIYNNHPYIFLRELMQNSIDAIKTRKAILEKRKVGGENTGIIKVKITKDSFNNIELTWQDDGIGMDEYIIKNYFSVIGKSYYDSRDFEIEDLEFYPISRFGIGVLSCFLLADEMYITTYRDPYMSPSSEGLDIKIKNVMQQFRVESIPSYRCEVGTTINLYINSEKMKAILEEKRIKDEDLNVISYLYNIAGFVEYPIVIEEMSRKVIILSPEYNLNKLSRYIENLDEYEILEDKTIKILPNIVSKDVMKVYKKNRSNTNDFLMKEWKYGKCIMTFWTRNRGCYTFDESLFNHTLVIIQKKLKEWYYLAKIVYSI